MINNLQINGVHTVVTEDMRLYVEKKIGSLDRFIPKNARESARVDIKLKEAKASDGQSFECEVIISLPKSIITVHKKAKSMWAAIDEAEVNVRHQLKRYKNLHNPSRLQRHLVARLRSQKDPVDTA